MGSPFLGKFSFKHKAETAKTQHEDELEQSRMEGTFTPRDKKPCGHSYEMATVSLQVRLGRKGSYLERVKHQLLGGGQLGVGDIGGPALRMKFLKEMGNFFCCWPCELFSSQRLPISLPSCISHLDNCSSFWTSAVISPFLFLSQITVLQSIFQNGCCLVSLFQGVKSLTSEHAFAFLTSSPTSEPTISHHRSYPPAQQNYSFPNHIMPFVLPLIPFLPFSMWYIPFLVFP